jgi:CTP:molybdopterin cytidylyltransferase MocA
MGTDLVVGGRRLAEHAARVLVDVCSPVVEVGPGWTGLEAVPEEPPRSGPLAAVAGGGAELERPGHRGPVLVLAVDMPRIGPGVLRFLAVDMPRIGPGVLRFLAAFPGPPAPSLPSSGEGPAVVRSVLQRGRRRSGPAGRCRQRSMRALLGGLTDLRWAGPRMWRRVADEEDFLDLDTPEDLGRDPTVDVER